MPTHANWKGQFLPYYMGQWGRRRTIDVFHAGHCIFPTSLSVVEFSSATNRKLTSLQEVKGPFSIHSFWVDAATLKILWSDHRALLVRVPLDLFLKTTHSHPLSHGHSGYFNSFVCYLGYIFWSRITCELWIEERCLNWPPKMLFFRMCLRRQLVPFWILHVGLPSFPDLGISNIPFSTGDLKWDFKWLSVIL